jgi:hypothetical protein
MTKVGKPFTTATQNVAPKPAGLAFKFLMGPCKKCKKCSDPTPELLSGNLYISKVPQCFKCIQKIGTHWLRPSSLISLFFRLGSNLWNNK